MKKILFATENPSKAKRFSKGLKEKGIQVITLKDIENKVEKMRISRCGLPPYILHSYSVRKRGGIHDRSFFIIYNKTSLFWINCRNYHCICLTYTCYKIKQIN